VVAIFRNGTFLTYLPTIGYGLHREPEKGTPDAQIHFVQQLGNGAIAKTLNTVGVSFPAAIGQKYARKRDAHNSFSRRADEFDWVFPPLFLARLFPFRSNPLRFVRYLLWPNAGDNHAGPVGPRSPARAAFLQKARQELCFKRSSRA
jgi:hypothetical protein